MAKPQRVRPTVNTAYSTETARDSAALVVSHVFDPGESGPSYAATVTVQGRRSGVRGAPGPNDAFVHTEFIPEVVPGSGPLTVTSRIYNVSAGEWSISAELESIRPDGRPRGQSAKRVQLRTAGWSWRHWSVVAGPLTQIARTRWAVLVGASGLARLPGSIPLFLILGIVFLVFVQIQLLGATQSTLSVVLVTALAGIAGLAGAKVWSAICTPASRYWPAAGPSTGS